MTQQQVKQVDCPIFTLPLRSHRASGSMCEWMPVVEAALESPMACVTPSHRSSPFPACPISNDFAFAPHNGRSVPRPVRTQHTEDRLETMLQSSLERKKQQYGSNPFTCQLCSRRDSRLGDCKHMYWMDKRQ